MITGRTIKTNIYANISASNGIIHVVDVLPIVTINITII
jgi:uncharacterized surface protein with fasciclin (FAS1) repeats